ALFGALGKWVEARNTEDACGLAEAHRDIGRIVDNIDEGLRRELAKIESEIEAIKEKLRYPEGRDAQIRKMSEKQAIAQNIGLYLSSALGRFSPEKFGQEVSWAWLDIATVAGVGDLLGVFMRQYNSSTPNSSVFFANL
ncbi:MAG: hypothetical protein PVH79_00075, partial [Candidatus Bathyarchaeota archaeon]